MKLGIACDHAGYELKIKITQQLEEQKIAVTDFGCDNSKDSVDYPDMAKKLCQNFEKESFDFGILICGSGIGISIAANRFKNIRAALCHSEETAKLSRQHNNANILCLGARIIDEKTALKAVKTFLNSDALNDRHKIRVDKLNFDPN